MSPFPEIKKNVLRERLKNIYSVVLVNPGGYLELLLAYKEHFAFSKEIFKTHAEWMTEPQIISVLFEKLTKIAFPNNRESPKDKIALGKFLGEAETKSSIELLIAYYEDFPKKYNFYIHVPNLMRFESTEIQLTESVALLQTIDEKLFDSIRPSSSHDLIPRRDLIKPKDVFKDGQIYLRISANGYCDGTSNTRAAELALAKLKHVLVLGVAANVFIEDPTYSYGPFSSHIILHEIADSSEGKVLSIRESVLKKVASFKFNHQIFNKPPMGLLGLGLGITEQVSPEERAIIITEKLKKVIAVAQSFDKDTADAREVCTACEWVFDASISDNETIAFIQVCMGIEAILGSYEKERSITNTLAERLAYTLGTTRTERKTLIQEFRNFYDVRSDVVHGRKAALPLKDKEFLNWGMHQLNRLIKRELEMFPS